MSVRVSNNAVVEKFFRLRGCFKRTIAGLLLVVVTLMFCFVYQLPVTQHAGIKPLEGDLRHVREVDVRREADSFRMFLGTKLSAATSASKKPKIGRLEEYCQALMNDSPTPQPCWGARELARRRRFGVAEQRAEGIELRNADIGTEINYVATNEVGEYIFSSEGGQDRWLYLNHFRFLTRPIVYADFGSNDPIFTSNTFFFDHCMDARGICVEANPQFIERYQRHRSCKLITSCLSNKEEQVSFVFQMKDYSTRSGISSTNKSYKNSQPNATGNQVNLTCTTGQRLFSAEKIQHIDWLDLDAEGHELHVLQGIDFEKTRIDIITVEANDRNVHRFLVGVGYRKVVRLHYDSLYLRNGFELSNQSYNVDRICV